MIDKKTILKIAEHVFKRGQGFYDKRMMHPTREWISGLFVFMIVVGLGAIQSGHTFLSYQNIQTEEGTFQEAIPKYNQALAKTVLDMYTKRQEVFFELQGNPLPDAVIEPEVVSEPFATSTVEVEESVDIEGEVVASSTVEAVGGIELAN